MSVARFAKAAGAYQKLSIIMPVFNEVNTVGEIIKRVLAVELPIAAELIIVDDGSRDGTTDLVRAIHEPDTKVLVHGRNRGKGAAVKTGLRHATGDIVVIQDADLEYDPQDIPRLLAPILKQKAFCVYGSRFTGEHRNMSFPYWLGNRFLSLVTCVLYNTTLSDMETCYKMFDIELLSCLSLRSNRFEIEPEITAKVLKRGVRIYEVPVSHAGREKRDGKKIGWFDGVLALVALFRYRISE